MKAVLELTMARESATITRVLAETQRQTEKWESFAVEEGEGFRYVLTGGWGSERQAN